MRSSQGRIQDWWDKGYLKADNQVLSGRFVTEAKATLPIIEQGGVHLDDVFAALNLQQIRVRSKNRNGRETNELGGVG